MSMYGSMVESTCKSPPTNEDRLLSAARALVDKEAISRLPQDGWTQQFDEKLDRVETPNEGAMETGGQFNCDAAEATQGTEATLEDTSLQVRCSERTRADRLTWCNNNMRACNPTSTSARTPRYKKSTKKKPTFVMEALADDFEFESGAKRDGKRVWWALGLLACLLVLWVREAPTALRGASHRSETRADTSMAHYSVDDIEEAYLVFDQMSEHGAVTFDMLLHEGFALGVPDDWSQLDEEEVYWETAALISAMDKNRDGTATRDEWSAGAYIQWVDLLRSKGLGPPEQEGDP
jgi:hypothetical protein